MSNEPSEPLLLKLARESVAKSERIDRLEKDNWELRVALYLVVCFAILFMLIAVTESAKCS